MATAAIKNDNDKPQTAYRSPDIDGRNVMHSDAPTPVANELSEVSHLAEGDNASFSAGNFTVLQLPSDPSHCIDYAIPAGTLVIVDPNNPDNNRTVKLQAPAVFRPQCALGGTRAPAPRPEESFPDWSEYQKYHHNDRRDPFYGSVTPIAYTIAASTVTAWMLLIILFLSRKPSPLFQKIAVLITAVSLTVFLAQATDTLESQYNEGYQNAYELRHKIMGGWAFRILQVITCVITWLARLQVVIRLFDVPKINTRLAVVGSTLIFTNATIWACLNFIPPWSQYVRNAKSVLPVFGALCSLLLEVFYLVVVVIYSISKRKYAYSRTSIVMAAISWLAMILPMVFIVFDIAHYWIAGWSDFIRWTADAAASVVVWEWTNVIVYQERREQRQSVLGRQVYRDEILDFKGDNGGGTVGGGRTKYPSRMEEDDVPFRSSPNDHHFTSNIPTSAGEGQSFQFFKRARLPMYSRKIWKIARGESAASNNTHYEHAIIEEEEEESIERNRRTPTVQENGEEDDEETYDEENDQYSQDNHSSVHSFESSRPSQHPVPSSGGTRAVGHTHFPLPGQSEGAHTTSPAAAAAEPEPEPVAGPSGGAAAHGDSDDDSDNSDDSSLASFTVIQQTGFSVDNQGVPEYDADSAPPTFEPIPGFHRQDYSDAKG